MARMVLSRKHVGVFTHKPIFSKACEEWCHPKELEKPEGVFVYRYLLMFDVPVTSQEVQKQLRDFGCYKVQPASMAVM